MKKRSIVWIFILLCFLFALQRLDAGHRAEGAAQLETAVRRYAVSCYAQEGFYPPDLAYMSEHYGLQIDEEKYFVHYEGIAENLMPEITVISRES